VGEGVSCGTFAVCILCAGQWLADVWMSACERRLSVAHTSIQELLGALPPTPPPLTITPSSPHPLPHINRRGGGPMPGGSDAASTNWRARGGLVSR